MSDCLIRLENIRKDFGSKEVLKSINLDVHDKEFVTFLGPSGCGKTTTLRIIGGFETPDSGVVYFDGKAINDVPPHKRRVNTVFQRYALFTHLDVFENIAFGLRVNRKSNNLTEKEIEKRVLSMLELVNLEGYEKRTPTSLSGGEQQRVAIARALANHPQVLLLDEPLGALDLKLRKEMQRELKDIQQELGITFIYVTHDQEEALTMSDTIVVMNKGIIQQVGTPIGIYNEPVNAFVSMLELVNLEGYEKRTPTSLSGGEQQRVAIARALANHPQVLLLDEPLGALDLKLRKEMQRELKDIQQELGITFIYVTHDQEEALTMSDTIVVMNKGIIQQVGTPIGIYNEPVNAFVADFIGESNIVPGVIHKDFDCSFGGKRFECTDQGFGKDEAVDVVIRPEDFKLVPPAENLICGTVESLVFKGVHYEMLVESKDGTEWLVHSTLPEAVGTEVGLQVAPFDIHIMKKSTREDQAPADADPESTEGEAEE